MRNEADDRNREPAPPAPAPPRRGRARGCLVAGLAAIGALVVGGFLLALFGGAFAYLAGGLEAGGGAAIGVVHIEGEIAGDRFGTGTDPESVIDQLRSAERNERVKSVVLRINSPGGSAAASQEIAMEVARMRKPVVASIGDAGASGAYWVASACDRVVAAPASSVGSIGVIMMITNLKGLFEKLGVRYVVIAKGKYKDMGNPSRELTDEERQLLSAQADAVYQQFIDDVAKNRRLPRSRVEELATGQVFLGSEAKRLGLVDELGNYRDAIRVAARLGHVTGEPEIVDLGEYAVPFARWLRYLLPFGARGAGALTTTVVR